jgi:hypothetical protein
VSATLSEAFVVFLRPPHQAGWYSSNTLAVYTLKRCRLLLNPYLGLLIIHGSLLTSRYVRHSVETAINNLSITKIALFWDVTPCSLVHWYQNWVRTFSLHIPTYQSTRCQISEENLHSYHLRTLGHSVWANVRTMWYKSLETENKPIALVLSI